MEVTKEQLTGGIDKLGELLVKAFKELPKAEQDKVRKEAFKNAVKP